MQTATFLQIALNGGQIHPAVPRTPAEIAVAARSAVDAGALSIHIHAYNDEGLETLDGSACAKVLRAIWELCPETSISVTTSETIVANPAERLRIIEAWHELPDFVSANQGEPGILELCESLIRRGVGIEAGLLNIHDARAFVLSGLADRCRRVLIEPSDQDPDTATQHAAAMEDVVVRAGITLPQVHHGEGMASWKINQRALERNHGIRTGLEDVTLLPDGQQARDNVELVRAGVRLIQNTRL